MCVLSDDDKCVNTVPSYAYVGSAHSVRRARGSADSADTALCTRYTADYRSNGQEWKARLGAEVVLVRGRRHFASKKQHEVLALLLEMMQLQQRLVNQLQHQSYLQNKKLLLPLKNHSLRRNKRKIWDHKRELNISKIKPLMLKRKMPVKWAQLLLPGLDQVPHLRLPQEILPQWLLQDQDSIHH